MTTREDDPFPTKVEGTILCIVPSCIREVSSSKTRNTTPLIVPSTIGKFHDQVGGLAPRGWLHSELAELLSPPPSHHIHPIIHTNRKYRNRRGSLQEFYDSVFCANHSSAKTYLYILLLILGFSWMGVCLRVHEISLCKKAWAGGTAPGF